MTRLEKAINGLESCNNMQCASCPYYDNGESFPAFPHCVPELRVDALELLKEKEPKVLTLEEANTFEVVWLEDRGTNTVFPCLVKNDMSDSKFYKYDIKWRAWSARPTDKQREAVKWDDE